MEEFSFYFFTELFKRWDKEVNAEAWEGHFPLFLIHTLAIAIWEIANSIVVDFNPLVDFYHCYGRYPNKIFYNVRNSTPTPLFGQIPVKSITCALDLRTREVHMNLIIQHIELNSKEILVNNEGKI